MVKAIYIYGHVFPGDEEIRYIGKSIDPKKRLRDHINAAKRGEKTRHANWIRSLLTRRLKPELVIIDEVSEECWQAIEAAYIQFYREKGCDLNNGTDGGEDPPSWAGKKLSPERREAIKAVHLGRKASPEQRAAQSAAHKGKKLTPEHCAAVSAAMTGRTLSPEHRAALRKPKSPAHCAAFKAAWEARRMKRTLESLWN